MEHQKIFGDYVLTGIQNAFNNKRSWWLSKKHMTHAMYCFSTVSIGQQDAKELAYQCNAIESYIHAFDAMFSQEDAPGGGV